MSSKQSIAIYFIHHNKDRNENIDKGIDYSFNLLKRDIQRPFSRALNLPVFFRTSLDENPPGDIPETADKTLVFTFIGNYLLINDDWVSYLSKLQKKQNYHVIPIALNSNAYNVTNSLNYVNFIRAYDFPIEFFNENLFISIAHEIYRITLNDNFEEIRKGTDTAIEFFLSHTKDGKQGENIAKQLKLFLDQSRLSCFFDATDIAHGYEFSTEIENHIKKSSLIAIHSDPYSSRYWCQKELEYAKKHNRPIIAVDCLEEYEDRRFPLFSNIPAIHVPHSQENKISDKDCYRIIITALLETIRFFYSKVQFKKYKQRGWIDSDITGLYRPPELLDILKIIQKGIENKKIIYPDPPVYEDEHQILKELNIDAKTILTYRFNKIKNKKIGISISDIEDYELIKTGKRPDNLILLSQDLARHILSREAILIYGGDLRPDGFTSFLLDEAEAIQNRLKSRKISIKNYISWPIYLNAGIDLLNWQARYNRVAKFEKCNLPKKLIPSQLTVDENNFIPPDTEENKYLWSKSLSQMRNKMIQDCDARICAGGRLTGYKGCMPGILEEVLYAIEHKKPLFLLGGFGGTTNYICHCIKTSRIPEELTRDWQIYSNGGYKMLLDYINNIDNKYSPNYTNLNEVLNYKNLNNGLSEEENDKLFNTEYIDEAIYLTLKGLDNLY
ncbi:TIR domain-containing protein [Dickeya undicola]|uniref:Toll/interleukin-1 receptor domain-containing protein n=1 Tax=Dickeya undicola TaxID=1577887 RepID=A0A3N0FVY2_9GAMM|nr:TIR domain-containing protein [Dickeya undicola]RNM04048.1 toll/interleukin-1 receptor domain-containing protein [Dickeya undicola]